MAGLIPQVFVDDLLSRVDLASLIAERVNLKKSGATYQGRCPFHDEKSPSFHVYNENHPAHYHCYGCGAHGDAINFIKETEHLSFNEAVEQLAKRCGVEVPRDRAAEQKVSQNKSLYDASSHAGAAFRQALGSHPQRGIAQEYLKRRGISTEMADLYGIGFAPAQRQFLSGSSDRSLIKALSTLRLVIEKEQDRFDMFQNRLMFPIRDTRGRTIAFGGRTLGNDRSKYINSPESPIFHKSNVLYGLWEARKQSRKLEQLIVVEGYLDVISLAQFGVVNAVAAMGTATNEDNLSHLLNTSQDIVFCFDGDKAGLAAADKALNNLLPMFQDGYKVSFLILPEGEDPDTFVRNEGADAFRERVANATPLSEYFFQAMSRGLDLSIAENKGILSTQARTALKVINAPVLKDALYQRLNELTRSSRWGDRQGKNGGGEWKKGDWKGKKGFSFQNRDEPREEPIPVPNRIAARACLGLYVNPSWAKEISNTLNYEITQDDERALTYFLEWLLKENIETAEDLLYRLAVDPHQQRRFKNLFNSLEHIFGAEEIEAGAQESLLVLKRKYFDRSFDKIHQDLSRDPKNKELHEKFRTMSSEKMAMIATPKS
ncbi:DNA primase [Hahella sp. HN01]|uniref:DNA primase n=1 Tax=Hahella sp. HN01 TaxID=2847262 RepID=UPI001C1EB4FF|nr:DNA primase [Hahella sp. HN01]MBU6955414.1 DNA primase [Hahella sp. HN01]